MKKFKKTDTHYLAVKDFYGDSKAERSGIPYITHIDEGIRILEEIDASYDAFCGYCLHPLFQSDESLIEFLLPGSKIDDIIYDYIITPKSIALAMEYRRVANSYLSKGSPESLVKTPIAAVYEMLIADKVQNFKDFELHHFGKHPRSQELMVYFKNWMKILGISDTKYFELKQIITNK